MMNDQRRRHEPHNQHARLGIERIFQQAPRGEVRLNGEAPRPRQRNIRRHAKKRQRRLERVRAALREPKRERLQPKLHQVEQYGVRHRPGQQHGRRARIDAHGDADAADDLEGGR